MNIPKKVSRSYYSFYRSTKFTIHAKTQKCIYSLIDDAPYFEPINNLRREMYPSFFVIYRNRHSRHNAAPQASLKTHHKKTLYAFILCAIIL